MFLFYFQHVMNFRCLVSSKRHFKVYVNATRLFTQDAPVRMNRKAILLCKLAVWATLRKKQRVNMNIMDL